MEISLRKNTDSVHWAMTQRSDRFHRRSGFDRCPAPVLYWHVASKPVLPHGPAPQAFLARTR